jgi:ElaB/YqjD/DUF883 family membrane-anchored ribosome-binding protein
MPDQISKLQEQLEEAESDLQQSLNEVNQRVESVDFRPKAESVIRRHPLAAIAIGAAAGYLLGARTTRSALFGALALGVIAGIELRSKRSGD